MSHSICCPLCLTWELSIWVWRIMTVWRALLCTVKFNTESQRLVVQKHLTDSGVPPVGYDLIMCIYVSSATWPCRNCWNRKGCQGPVFPVCYCFPFTSHRTNTRKSVTCSRHLFLGLSPQQKIWHWHRKFASLLCEVKTRQEKDGNKTNTNFNLAKVKGKEVLTLWVQIAWPLS